MRFHQKTAQPEQSRAPRPGPGTPPPSGQVDKQAEARAGDHPVFCLRCTVVFPISCEMSCPLLV